jgi:class 3 adenylate cyclase/tetratricopeptide (TPR) repeat protein
MFCDLVGSTALAAQIDPEDLREIIGAFQRCVTETVTRHGGFVARYMGDGALIYFGYPEAHEDDAERAVRAGLSAVGAVSRLELPGDFTPHVRIGIATGLVVVGDIVGVGGAPERDVAGETPNMAARLQALAEPDSVVIAASTHRLTGGLFEYRDLGSVAAKGFPEPVRAWRVLRESGAESRFEALHAATVLSPLIGREEELDLLLRRWRKAKDDGGRAVLLSGEPGVGKSRLATALAEHLQAEPHIQLRYFCAPHYTDSALRPIVLQLARAAGFDADDPPSAKWAKLAAMLARTATPTIDVALLAHLLSLPPDERRPLPDLTPQRRKELTFEALVRQLEALAGKRPVLMVFEDVHWIDPSSRELLDLVVDRVRRWPVLLLVTFRPEFAPPWTGLSHVTFLALNRLGRREGAALIERLTGGRPLPPAVVEQIVDRTDGVPLFVEELTKTVLESGLLRESGRSYVLGGPLPPLAIPTTLQASLMARLDRLATVKDIAQTAAVIGREFSHALVAAVAALPDADLCRGLDQLVEAGLIFRRGTPPDASYLFKHALVQDAAYGSLLKSRRQQLHQRIAQVLEANFPHAADAEPEVLARHYAEAGLVEQAIDKWEAAGHKAMARSAQIEAAAHLREAVRLVRSLAETGERRARELALLLPLGQAAFASVGGGAPETEAIFTRAKELARDIGDREAFCRAVYGLNVNFTLSGRFDESLSLGAEARTFADGDGSVLARVVAERVLGTAHYHRGELLDSERHLRSGVDVFRRQRAAGVNTAGFAHDPFETMPATLALVTWALGRPDEAVALAEESLHAVEAGGDTNSIAYVRTWLSFVHLFRREPDAVERCTTSMIHFAEERGARFWANVGVWLQGVGLAQTDRLDEALTKLRTGTQGFLAAGSRQIEPLIRYSEAEIHLRRGRMTESRECLALAQKSIEETNQRFFEPETNRIAATLHQHRGELEQAEIYYRKAIDVARSQSGRSWELRAATGLARLWLGQGKAHDALALLAPLYDRFDEGFDTPDLREARALLDELRRPRRAARRNGRDPPRPRC